MKSDGINNIKELKKNNLTFSLAIHDQNDMTRKNNFM